jgi:hypothetical protein
MNGYVVFTSPNVSVSKARNHGIRLLKGDYAALAESP